MEFFKHHLNEKNVALAKAKDWLHYQGDFGIISFFVNVLLELRPGSWQDPCLVSHEDWIEVLTQ